MGSAPRGVALHISDLALFRHFFGTFFALFSCFFQVFPWSQNLLLFSTFLLAFTYIELFEKLIKICYFFGFLESSKFGTFSILEQLGSL